MNLLHKCSIDSDLSAGAGCAGNWAGGDGGLVASGDDLAHRKWNPETPSQQLLRVVKTKQ